MRPMRIAAVTLAGLVTLLPAAAENLLANPSFEEVEDGLAAGWRCGGFDWYEEPEGAGLSRVEIDETVVQGPGQRSLKLIGEGNRGIVRQTLRYRPGWGRTLRVSGWIKLQETGSATGQVGVTFVSEDEWLDEAGVHTSWQKSTADWERFEREVPVPEDTTHLHVHCRSVKPNSGVMWFDNVALEPVAQVETQAQAERRLAREDDEAPAGAEARGIDPLIPVDTFEGDELRWSPSAWGGAEGAELTISEDDAFAGEAAMRVQVRSADNNWLTRAWNCAGPWDGLTAAVRSVDGRGLVKMYLRAGTTVFNAGSVRVAPDAGWKTISIARQEITHAWGGQSEEDRRFDPDALTHVCIGWDDAITFEVDQIALDVRDEVGIRSAHTDHEANLFSPGERPVVAVEAFNGFDAERACELAVRVTDYRGRTLHELSREVTLAARTYHTETEHLPELDAGYHVATVTLSEGGRVLGAREVGICALPEPVREGRAFMGASGFGLGTNTADVGARLGVRASEVFIDWHRCEPERGELVFEHIEPELEAFIEHGFEVTGMLHLRPSFTPGWATDDEHDFAVDPPDYARFVEACVEHFRGRINRWSFCSEVDLAHRGWKQGLEGYVEMVAAGSEGARRADPDCIIGGVGVSGGDARKSPRFPVARRLWPRLSEHLDGMFFDLYASPRFFGPGLHVVSPGENDLEGKLREALQIVRASGAEKRIAIEEKGWAIDPELDVDNQYSRRMAEYLARSYLVARSVDAVDHYMWFQIIVRRLSGGSFSYSLFRSEGDYANPRPAAAAYAFVAQLLGGVERPRAIPLHQDLRAIVFAHEDGSRAALWTPLDEPVSLEVDLPASARVTDLMSGEIARGGDGRQRLELSGSPIYVWADGTGPDALARRLEAASFYLPCAKLAMTMPRIDLLRLHVNNQLAAPLTGRASIELPEGFVLREAGREVEVDGGARAVFEFALERLPEPLPQRPGAFEARLRTDDHGEVRRAEEPTFRPLPRLDAPARIDGDLAEYADLPAIELAQQAFLSPPDAVANRLWTGPDDLSVSARVAWDDDRLYFAARVRDDEHVQETTGSRIWTNDAFQLAIDPLNDALGGAFRGTTGYDANDQEFGIALTPDGPATYQWHGSPEGGRTVPEAELAVRRGEGETVYEWALPWRVVGHVTPASGVVMGLNFIALDADAPGEQAAYWMGLTEGISGGKDPAAFNTFVLTP